MKKQMTVVLAGGALVVLVVAGAALAGARPRVPDIYAGGDRTLCIGNTTPCRTEQTKHSESPAAAATGSVGRVVTAYANVRSEPRFSADQAPMGTLDQDAVITVSCRARGTAPSGAVRDWYRLKEPLNVEGGYVAAGLIEVTGKPPLCLQG